MTSCWRGWRCLALQVTTRGQARKEVVWFDFAPDPVHRASCAGPELHRLPALQAQGGQRYKAPAGGRTPRGDGRHDGRRCRGPVSVSRWHEDLAAPAETFACPQELLDPSSFATTPIKAIREWRQGLLRRGHGAPSGRMPRSSGRTRPCANASPSSSGARCQIAPPAASRPPATAWAGRGRPRGPAVPAGPIGRTLTRTEVRDDVVDHCPSACSGCGASLSDPDRHGAPVCRQVSDMSEPRPLEVTGYRAHCCLCGIVTRAVFRTP